MKAREEERREIEALHRWSGQHCLICISDIYLLSTDKYKRQSVESICGVDSIVVSVFVAIWSRQARWRTRLPRICDSRVNSDICHMKMVPVSTK